MDTIQKGNYGARISNRNDGRFDVVFLYGMDTIPTDCYCNGYACDLKTYKTKKMALTKIEKYFQREGAA